jgi:hypothetical protein
MSGKEHFLTPLFFCFFLVYTFLNSLRAFDFLYIQMEHNSFTLVKMCGS